MEIEFNDKVAFVTGGASGIGRAAAIAFARSRAKVVVADIDKEGGEETVDIIRSAKGEASFVFCDASNEDHVRNAVDFTIQKYQRLDCAFNNAGTEGVPATTVEGSTLNWDHVIDVNLKGVWLCMKYQIPHLLKQKRGTIVNCSSIVGIVGWPQRSALSASKHGVIGLTQTAALELARTGVRVNAICPGVVKTPMMERFMQDDNDASRDQLIAAEPDGRVGTPEEIADAVLWLCSDRSSFVTGHSLIADGGWVARKTKSPGHFRRR